MKKFTLFLFATLFSALSFAALNPYAYGLSSELSLDEATLTVKYSLNADATGVNIVILNGETVVETISCDGKTKGNYTVEIPTASFPKSTSLTWQVEVLGNSVATPTKQTTTFSFYLPYSMDVDVDTESDYFGRWYVIEATNGGKGKSGYHSTSIGRGLYAFDAALEPIKNNSGTYGFTGGMTLGANTTNAAGDYINLACVTTSGGRVFVGRYEPGLAPILEATDLHSNNYPLVLRSGGGRAIALDARGRGENLQLVMLDTDFNIKEYDLGTAEEWTTAATPSRTFNKTGLIIDRNDAAIAYDNEGGLWVNQNSASNPTIAHLSTSGLDYDNITAGLSHILGAAKYNIRGVAINQDGTELAVPAAGRGKVTVFTISKDSEGKISLTQKYTITTGNNNTALSYDYAGNLYIANRSAETISFYAMPYDGEVSTPAASKYAFQLTEVVPEVYTVTVEKVGEGTIEGGGEYLENSTVTLKATPEEHYEFTGWTGDVTSNENPLTINVDGNKTITANFAKKQYTLTVFVNDENKGTIDVATGSHEYGTEVTLTATPKPGYKLLAWSNKATTSSITLTMDNNKAVSAYFVKEYATDPTFTIEKVWENTNVPAATANGFQGVGWDGKIYVKDRYNAAINVYTETGSELYAQLGATVTGLAGDQPIAVDDAGNLVVRSGSTNFYDSPTQVSIFRKNENTPEVIDFTLPATGRCDFISASGDIFGEKGGYVYFFCMNQTTVSRLHIKNGEYKGVDTIAIVAEEGKAASQSHVVVDIYGNIHTSSKGKNAYEYNITTLTTTADSYLGAATKKTPKSTIGGCTFELGGKELWAYVAGTTNYSSEWELKNVTDGVLVSEDVLYAKDKTTVNSNTVANWLNVQVVDEKTAYIYQFCPTVAAAVWKVSFKENYTVSASATNGTVTGAGTYQEGATATLTATPNTGYKFVNWTTGGVEVSTEATYSFPVTENVELVANFEALAQYTINAHADHTSKGYVTGGGDYYEGEEVVLKATAKSGYYFTQWNDGNTNNPRAITVTDDAEYIAEFAKAYPRAWAYDMKMVEDGDNYKFSFTATTAANATLLFLDKEGNELYPAHDIGAVAAGANTVSIEKSYFTQVKDVYWSVKMDGEAITAVAEITDQSRGIYDFYSTLGVTVDNNPNSEYFGKVYVQATLNGASDGATTRAKEQTAGLFIYNQLLDELNPTSNVGIQPSLPSGYSIGGTSQFNRLAIDPTTNNITYCYAVSGKPAVFSMDRANLTGTPANLLAGQSGITRSVAHCFDTDGALYVMDLPGSGTIYKIKDGVKTQLTETTNKFVNPNITMTSDGRGGLWVSQNRGQMDGSPYYYQLAHVTSAGAIDWAVNQQTPHGFEGSSSRGALAYDVERQILAQGRNGKVELYTVNYEPTITLTPLYTIASDDLGNNIDGLAFDYAGDLYVVNSSKEKFQKFTLPSVDNICTVPAPESQIIKKEARYTVTVAVNDNAMGTATGGGEFVEGETATLEATPAAHHKFVNWTYGSETSTNNPLELVVNSDITVTANFAPVQYTLIAPTNDENKGTVTGAGTYNYGTEVILTATPKEGYKLLYWSDRSTENPRTITMNKDEALSAYFVKEYDMEPSIKIEKVWENTQVPASAEGYQSVGWDGKIYMQNKTAGKIKVYSNGTDAAVDYANSNTSGQQIAVDAAGNLIVFNATFYTITPNAIMIYPKGSTTGTAISFTLPHPERCDFISASGDIYSAEGGYVYFYCQNKNAVNRVKITNGALASVDAIGNTANPATSVSHVMVDIFGNLAAHCRSTAVYAINSYTGETTTFNTSLDGVKLSTLGGCSFELGGKELWAYNVGTTHYNSEWNLYNMTDGEFLSDETLYAKDKVSKKNTGPANWLNVQVVDENTAYIYQFCPEVAVAVWKVTCTTEKTVIIDEEADNTTALAPYEGELVDKATVKRNFEANKCYTLTLPFDMSAAQISTAFGNATVYEFYNIVENGSEELYLEFVPTSSIQAGEPCLIVTPSGSFDANDGFEVEDVIISTNPQPVQVGAVTMMPVLDNGYEMTSSDEYYVWNGGLYCAGTYNMTSKGLRAYFTSSSPLPLRSRVVLKDNEATSIPLVGVGQDDQVRKIMKDGQIIIIRGEEQYNIQGQRMD